ncbi:MAG: L-threonylcarbamoyladenylate synthase [Gammaproteobacteria bacterium]
MQQLFKIHSTHPQARLVSQAAARLRTGAVMVYPTDSCYALGCCLGEKGALERMRRIRELEPKHLLTLVCRDLSELATYARVDNQAYRLLRSLTPGPYTFVLTATRELPRRLQDSRRRTIGLRVPAHPVACALLEALGEPLISTSLILPGAELPETDPETFSETLAGAVDIVIDSGPGGVEPTSVIDLCSDVPRVVREGKGDVSEFAG